MLNHHDSSLAVGGIQRHDISIIRDNQYQNSQTQRELDESETSKSRQCCKKAAKFLFSHIGLVGLVVVYAVAGGFLFELLEQHQERLNCQEAAGEHSVQLTKLKQKLVAYIQYNITSESATSSLTATYSTDKDNKTVGLAKIGAMLYDYRDFVIQTGAKYRYYGDDCSTINKWTYPNALLFAITIITTIGYGNITPVTWEGQICCICYATIGIPIFLLCVANISGVLGEMFRFLYSKILCRPCTMIKKRRAYARQMKSQEIGQSNRTNNNNNNNNGWSMDEENSSNKRRDNFLNEADANDAPNPNQRVTVPLTITMLIIAAYIWAGSMIFNKFEGWSMAQAGYFCFITLATIGFGDFVPGQGKNTSNAALNLIIGAVYVLFGMAILAMCFDLMQEEIVAKFRWLGRKIGLVDKEDESPDKNNNNNNNNSSPANTERKTSSKMFDDENDTDNGWSTQRSGNEGRKPSPRVNIARVHPLSADSNDGSLHQRSIQMKNN